MTTDFRALCIELVNELHGYASANPHHDSDALVTRARTALAEPEPEVVGPSDEELYALWNDCDLGWDEQRGMVVMPHIADFARAALARYGHQPAPPAGELLKEAAWLRNECSAENADGNWISMSIDQALDLASLLERQAAPAPAAGEVGEAALVRRMCDIILGNTFGNEELDSLALLVGHHPDVLNASPVPVPVAAGEVGELVTLLRQVSDGANACDDEGTTWIIARAAELLEQRHPAPVPVSERLPGAEDCDEMGQCWWFDAELWCLDIYDHEYTHWLPAHALPLPSGEVG